MSLRDAREREEATLMMAEVGVVAALSTQVPPEHSWSRVEVADLVAAI